MRVSGAESPDADRAINKDEFGGAPMNKEQVKGNWNQLKGKIKEQWGKLTDDDITVVEGRFDQLAGRVQERYGIAKEEAERQVKEFEDRSRMS
jgi:uncharacterized protein YjbJ (UPF0337 family)